MSSLNKRRSIPFSVNNHLMNLQNKASQYLQQISNPSLSKSKPKTRFSNRTEEWLVNKKKVPMTDDEYLIDEFNCGYSGNIVVTGKIYITNKRICFYSPFNDKNIFFTSTFINIPKEEILKIEKKHNAKIFDNSIEITKKNLETVFFTSFVSRNQCYDLMVSYLVDPSTIKSKEIFHKKSDYDYDIQFLSSKVVLEEFQYLINSFSCGLATKVNIMGRFYLTNRRIYFYSLFNEQGNTDTQTEISIMADDILRIEKRYNTLIFDNSILIVTKKGSFFFTSFLARDKVFHMLVDIFVDNHEVAPQMRGQEEEEQKFYDVIQEEMIREEDFGKGIEKMNQSLKVDFIQHEKKLFELQSPTLSKKNSILTYNEELDTQKVSEQEFRKKAEQNDDIKEKQLKSREDQIMSIISRQNNLETIGETVVQFPGLNALKALRIFDSGQEFFIHGRKFSDFMGFFKEQIMNRKNVKISKWKPNILEYLNTSNIKSSCPLEFERDFDEIVRLQRTGIPFMPKEAKSKEFQRLFLISKDKYVIESYVQNSGAPYADNFHINGRRVVETVSEDSIKITVSMEMVFKKKPMLSSLIESKCEEEGIKQQQKMFDAMKEYFKNLQQSKIKK